MRRNRGGCTLSRLGSTQELWGSRSVGGFTSSCTCRSPALMNTAYESIVGGARRGDVATWRRQVVGLAVACVRTVRYYCPLTYRLKTPILYTRKSTFIRFEMWELLLDRTCTGTVWLYRLINKYKFIPRTVSCCVNACTCNLLFPIVTPVCTISHHGFQ